MATSLNGESASAELNLEDEGASTDWRAKATQYQQELAKQKELHKQAVPYVEFVNNLQDLPGGKAIIEKVMRGETLTAKEEKKVEDEGLSVEKLEELFDKKLTALEQKLWQKDKAKDAMTKLEERASEELEFYNELRSSPHWNSQLNIVLNLAQQGALDIPDDETDPYYWAVRKTYYTILAEHPGLGEKKPAKKSESERKAAIHKGTSKSAGAPEEEDVPAELAFARGRPKLEVGKPLHALRKSR